MQPSFFLSLHAPAAAAAAADAEAVAAVAEAVAADVERLLQLLQLLCVLLNSPVHSLQLFARLLHVALHAKGSAWQCCRET